MDDSTRAASAVSPELLQRYFELSFSSRIVVWPEPWIEILIDPGERSLALRVDATGSPPRSLGYEHVRLGRLDTPRGPVDQIEVLNKEEDWASFALLVSVVERLINGVAFNEAALGALRAHEALLDRTAEILTLGQLVGLFGEVLVLGEIVQFVQADIAVNAWQGPDGVEHDFALAGGNLEVKTTLSEPRRHTIKSLRQLEPTQGAPLDLVSVRVTESSNGETLRELVDRVGHALGDASEEFFLKVAKHPLLSSGSTLLERRLRKRDDPRLFRVGTDVRPLTRQILDEAMTDSSHLQDISYVLDLEGRPSRPMADRFARPIRSNN